MSDFDTAYEVIGLLRAAGITIALDDFGTGFSSLSHIHRLEFDKIKIDKSFVLQFEKDVRCMNITRSVASLCHNLGIDAVAEGVETAEIASALHACGVRLAQGYHFCRPSPVVKPSNLRWNAGGYDRAQSPARVRSTKLPKPS